jgi:selenide,water dikinase
MLRLNRAAAEVLQALDVRGATDITGFGLLGHGAEMVEASGVGLLIHAAKLPLLDGALALAEKGLLSGGMKRNRRYLESTLGAKGQLVIDTAISPGLVSLLFEAETSGGLLFSVPQGRADRVTESFKKRGEACWEIGEVTQEPAMHVV